MLTLRRRPGESLLLYPAADIPPDMTLAEVFSSGPIRVEVTNDSGRAVKLAIGAPDEITVMRSELKCEGVTMSFLKTIKNIIAPRVTAHRVNRGVLRILPKEPFVRWIANACDMPLDEARERAAEERNAYLLPQSLDFVPAPEALDATWKAIFELELGEWKANPRRWPQPLTRKLFDQWFEVSWSDQVLDLCAEPLERDVEPFENF